MMNKWLGIKLCAMMWVTKVSGFVFFYVCSVQGHVRTIYTGPTMWRNIVLCLVSAQVNAFPSIWPSLREYFGALMVTWYLWLMLIAPHRAPLSLPQQAKANPAAIIILKIIPQKWSHHWIIQPSSLVRTLPDLWHHSSRISFSRCVSQKILKQESHCRDVQMFLSGVSNCCFLRPRVNFRKCLSYLKSVFAALIGLCNKAPEWSDLHGYVNKSCLILHEYLLGARHP